MSSLENYSPAEPAATAKVRVITYIDGFNLYFGMKEKHGRRFHWLNLVAMSEAILKPGQTLVGVKYFTSRISTPAASVKRQNTYIEALQTLPSLTIFEGQYEGIIEKCNGCGDMIFLHNEKMTDVNIAVEVTKDAHANNFDTAIIVTGDSDQTPTVRMLKSLFPVKRIISAFPPERKSKRLRQESHGFTDINATVLAKSQLPLVVVKAGGIELKKPPEWG